MLLLVCGLVWPGQALTKNLDARGTDPFLDQYVEALDRIGFDTVQGLVSDFGITEENRPRVARLGGFPLPLDAPHPKSEDWMRQFKEGAFTFITAFRPTETVPEPPSEPDEFLQEWEKAPVQERVFIAFTREDTKRALKLAEVLRADGMVVFTYLKGKATTPWADPLIVGRLFSEAGHHFVIDSDRARKSGGVAFEALNYARLKTETRRAKPDRAGACRKILGGSDSE